MINLIKKLFTLPSFDNDMQTYTARMLRVVLSFVALLSIIYTGINIANDRANSLRYSLQFMFTIIALVIMVSLIRRGHPRSASIILIFSTWAIFTTAAYTGGGVLSSGYIGYLVILSMAGLVAARPIWTLAAAMLCAGSGYALLYAEKNGRLPIPSVAVDSYSIWLDSLIYFSLVASLQILASRIVLDALRRARLEGQKKQEAEEREKERAKLFQRVIELGKEVTQAEELDWCLKTIHQSIQKGLGFDRVGLFLYDEELHSIQGTYGTDRQGNIEDISHYVRSAEKYDDWHIALQNPNGISLTKNYTELDKNLSPESEMYGVGEHITLAAWAGKKPVALIALDNVISGQPFSEEKIEALRLFAGYAGLAIVNARRLEAVNQELESFSYSVSHDLRSPLRAVVGFSQILMTDFNNSNGDGDSLQYLKKINENGKKMGKLIDDLLNFSRVGRQTLRIITCDNKSIVESIIEQLREKYPNNNAQWLVQDLPTCQADYVMIQQVWLNLLENANKYSLSSQHPEIEVGSLQEDEQTIFFVRDNGQGFEMQYADKIFRIFHRLDHDGELDSTGVGLAIVQRVLQRHGGKIWTNSQPRQGATFFFSLP